MKNAIIVIAALLITNVCTSVLTHSFYKKKMKEVPVQTTEHVERWDKYEVGQWDGMAAAVEYLKEKGYIDDTTTIAVEITEIMPLFREYEKNRKEE